MQCFRTCNSLLIQNKFVYCKLYAFINNTSLYVFIKNLDPFLNILFLLIDDVDLECSGKSTIFLVASISNSQYQPIMITSTIQLTMIAAILCEG